MFIIIATTIHNLISHLLFLAYGKVYLVRKRGGIDHGKLYAMKVLRKAVLVQKKKSAEHTKTEREVSLVRNPI